MGCASSSPVKEPQVDGQAAVKSVPGRITSAAESPRDSALQEAPLGRLSSTVVNNLFASPAPPRERRISQELADLNVVDNKGRLSVEFSRDLRESFSGARVSASLADATSKHVLIYSNDGSPPLLLKRLVGKGGFGSVFVGEWDGKEVAVKVVAPKEQKGNPTVQAKAQEDQHQQMTQLEAILMAIVDHPNIVHTHKVMCGSDAPPDADKEQCIASLSFYIIMENAKHGSLWSGLVAGRFHQDVQDAPKVSNADSRALWDAWSALETLKEVVSAMMYLHNQGVIHGDLKAANVLLCDSQQDRRGFVSKVTDFGFSRIATGHDTKTFAMRTNTYGTVTHMPPELLSEGVLTATTDIYSIGIIMWEVYTARAVFKELTDQEVIAEVVNHRARPDFPADTPASYKRLAQNCWAENLRGRPPLEVVLHELEEIQNELCPQGPESKWLLISGGTTPKQRRVSLQGNVHYKSEVVRDGGRGGSTSGAPGEVGKPGGMRNVQSTQDMRVQLSSSSCVGKFGEPQQANASWI